MRPSGAATAPSGGQEHSSTELGSLSGKEPSLSGACRGLPAPGWPAHGRRPCHQRIRPLELQNAVPRFQEPFVTARPVSRQWEMPTLGFQPHLGSKVILAPASCRKGEPAPPCARRDVVRITLDNSCESTLRVKSQPPVCLRNKGFPLSLIHI